jgi:ribosome recycling factor
METPQEILKETRDKMDKSLSLLHEQFQGIRTGKASPALVENIKVDYYGTQTRIKELAGISAPEPRLIVISPYDPTVLGEIEKAILAANLGVTPVNDGKVIRVPFPELSEERRKELVKVAKRIAEESRVSVRNVRREANDQAKKLEKDSKISEDDCKQCLEDVQKATDKHIEEIDKLLESKENEIMSV